MNQMLQDARGFGSAVRQARGRLSLSQQDLAARIGVRRMTVSRLERGEDVSITTALRALGACGVALAATPARGWMTAAEHAEAIDTELAAGDPDFALRLLRQALEDLDYLVTKEDWPAVAEFLAGRPAISDQRWQSMFCLVVAAWCRRHRIDPPTWARAERLDEPFFPGRPGRRFLQRTLERTPTDLADANIWIDERDLSYA